MRCIISCVVLALRFLGRPNSPAWSCVPWQGPATERAHWERSHGEYGDSRQHHSSPWRLHTGTSNLCPAALRGRCTGEMCSKISAILAYCPCMDSCSWLSLSGCPRWMWGLSMAVLLSVMLVLLAVWSVPSCYWIMGQKSTPPSQPSLPHPCTRPAYEVKLRQVVFDKVN